MFVTYLMWQEFDRTLQGQFVSVKNLGGLWLQFVIVALDAVTKSANCRTPFL